MAAPQIHLLSHLEDLTSEDMMEFKWYLGQNYRDGSRPIPRSRLENANRMDIVDQLVMHYGVDGAVDTTVNILLNMNHNDLAIRLTQVNISKRQRSPKVDEDPITQDLSCPICDNIFTEPVALHCGHSFCRTCLHDHWRGKDLRKCPQCSQVIHTVPQINLALNSLSSNYKKRRQLDPAEGNKDDLLSETVPSIHAVVQHFQPNCNAHGSIVVNPAVIGSRIDNISISIISGQGSLVFAGETFKHNTADRHGALQTQSQDRLMVRHHPSNLTPDVTSSGTGFNKNSVGEFFDNLSNVMDRYKFPPNMIYNVGEIGLTTVPTTQQVVAVKGKKQEGTITSAERKELVTVVCAVNAIGNAVPPIFIFPGDRYEDHFITGAPLGSIGTSTSSGWITEETFAEFLEHLVRHTNCSPDHPMLLILDNHEAHILRRGFDIAKRKGIVMLTTPPNTSHRLLPLYKSVYDPFMKYYNSALDGWRWSNQGKTASIYHIPGCVNEAFMLAMIPQNISSGFKSTGISPYNRHIFSDADFEPDKPNPELQSAAADDPPVASTSISAELASYAGASTGGTNSHHSHTGYVSPAEILPSPQSQEPRAKKKRAHVKKIILPDKLEEERAHKKTKNKKGKKHLKTRKAYEETNQEEKLSVLTPNSSNTNAVSDTDVPRTSVR